MRLVAAVTERSYRHRWLFLGASIALTIGAVALASRLEIRSSFAELLPENLPSVSNLKELIRRVGGDGTVLISIEALPQTPEGGLAPPKALAERLSPARPTPSSSPQPRPWPSGSPMKSGRSAPRRSARSRTTFEKPSAGMPTIGRCSSRSPTFERRAMPWRRRFTRERRRPTRCSSISTPPHPRTLLAPARSFRIPTDIAPWLDPSQPTPREKVNERFARSAGWLLRQPRSPLGDRHRPAGRNQPGRQRGPRAPRSAAGAGCAPPRRAHARRPAGQPGGTFPLMVAEY